MSITDTLFPVTYRRIYFTTARVIHEEKSDDWLWVNPSKSHQYDNTEEAQTLANLANHNGSENGLDVTAYPYFVIEVQETSHLNRRS